MTNMNLQPLTPPGCDLMNFPRMGVVVQRLLNSETWIEAARDPRLGHVLMSLWCASWHQLPAASLPANDDTLYRMSMCPTEKEWQRVRGRVLRDWRACSDGRLYHPVVAELAIECWLEKLAQRRKSVTGNASKYKTVPDYRQVDALEAEAVGMLRALNPNSPRLAKKRGAGAGEALPARGLAPSRGGPSGTDSGGSQGSHRDPRGAPTGSAQGPHGDPTAVLVGSQEKRRDISPLPPRSGCGQLDPAGTGGTGSGGQAARSGMPQHVRDALGAIAPGMASGLGEGGVAH